MEETKRRGMSKDQFWNLIEKAKEVCGTDLDASAVWIKQQLFYMTPEDVLQFHNLVYSYRDAAYKYGLWTAAGIMMKAFISLRTRTNRRDQSVTKPCRIKCFE